MRASELVKVTACNAAMACRATEAQTDVAILRSASCWECQSWPQAARHAERAKKLVHGLCVVRVLPHQL